MATTKSTTPSRTRAAAAPKSKSRTSSEVAVGKRASAKKTPTKSSTASESRAGKAAPKPAKAHAATARPAKAASRASASKTMRTNGTTVESEPTSVTWNLRLYVAGDSPRSRTALANLERLCESRLKGDYRIEVIDLTKKPHLAKADQILAVPTLIRSIPEPMKRIIGDLSDADRALVALDLQNAVNER